MGRYTGFRGIRPSRRTARVEPRSVPGCLQPGPGSLGVQELVDGALAAAVERGELHAAAATERGGVAAVTGAHLVA